MAKILGNSQAWQQVAQVLKTQNLKAENVNDIKKLLNTKTSEYEKRKLEEIDRFEDESKRLSTELEIRKKYFEADLAIHKQNIALEIEIFQIAILLLQNETRFFRKALNGIKIRKLRKMIDDLNIKQSKQRDVFLTKIAKMETSINYRQAHKETIIDNNFSTTIQDIKVLKEIVSSPELAGADAELEIIEHLKKLPDNCYVISGITLARDKAKKFDGQWLKTAQIDHLVISPAGVFVIEAKNWSKEFAKQGNYFDPYQQVKRANYLCYEILRGPLIDVKVRSIIAHRGGIPEKPKESYVKALHINELNNYILRFKDKILSDTEMKKMISYLRIWSKNGF